MLNKTERAVLEQILTEMKKVHDYLLYNASDFTKTYTVKRSEWDIGGGGFNEIEEERECLNYDTLYKLRDDMDNPLDQLKKLLDGEFQYKATHEQTMKRWHYLQNKEAEKKKQIKKEGAIEFMKEKSLDVQKLIWKKEREAHSKGFNNGKEAVRMTPKEILNKARQLEIEMKLGYHEDLKKELEKNSK